MTTQCLLPPNGHPTHFENSLGGCPIRKTHSLTKPLLHPSAVPPKRSIPSSLPLRKAEPITTSSLLLDTSIHIAKTLDTQGTESALTTSLETQTSSPELDSPKREETSPSASSEIHRVVSSTNLFNLCAMLLKLNILQRSLQKWARWQERQARIEHDEKTRDIYRSQGKWLLSTGISCCALSMVSAALPIFGYVPKIAGGLRGVLGSLMNIDQSMKNALLFKSLGKMTFAMAEMQKQMGQIHNTYSDGDRVREQSRSDLARQDAEEFTRLLQEYHETWRSIIDLWHQLSQQEQDSIRLLYS